MYVQSRCFINNNKDLKIAVNYFLWYNVLKGGVNMWFYLDLDGIDFHFRISKYRKSVQNIWDEQWCKVDLTLQSESWLNYQTSSEILLSCEVEQLCNKLSDLLSNQLQSKEELEFIEPDLSFILHPQKDLRLDPKYTYVAPGHEIVDISADICVHLWNGGLTANYISLCFGREDIEAFCSYLKLITNQFQIDDPSVKKLIDSDIIRINSLR